MTERRYNQWAGNPNGDKENPLKCIQEVRDSSGWHSYQCARKRGFGKEGLYCKQHAKIMAQIEARNEVR